MGWIGRSEKKHKKRRAKQRKAESRGGQQQVEESIGEEVAGKAAGRWRDLRRRVEVHVAYHAKMGGMYDLAIRLKLEQEVKREHNRDVLERFGELWASWRQKSAVTFWLRQTMADKIEKLKQEAARQERNEAMRSALRQNSHPAEFIALGGDEQRMALDGSLYTASEFCDFYRDKYMVDALWFWENGYGIENDCMLGNARQEFAYLMNA